jgi:hypothetical protein
MGRRFTSQAYRVARYSDTARMVRKGRAFKRARNVAIGRGLAKAGVFGWLWGDRRKR